MAINMHSAHFMPAKSGRRMSDEPSFTKSPALAGGLAMGRAPSVLFRPVNYKDQSYLPQII
jgi:hypothetical protein